MPGWSPPRAVLVAVDTSDGDTLITLRLPEGLDAPLAPAWILRDNEPILHLDAVVATDAHGTVTFRTEESPDPLAPGDTYGFQQWWTPEAFEAVRDVFRSWIQVPATPPGDHQHCLSGYETIEEGVGDNTGWTSDGDWICSDCYQLYISEDHLRIR